MISPSRSFSLRVALLSFRRQPSNGCGRLDTRYALPTVAEHKPEPTEKTPKGFEVRVPKRREFFSNLKKIAGKGSATRGPTK